MNKLMRYKHIWGVNLLTLVIVIHYFGEDCIIWDKCYRIVHIYGNCFLITMCFSDEDPRNGKFLKCNQNVIWPCCPPIYGKTCQKVYRNRGNYSHKCKNCDDEHKFYKTVKWPSILPIYAKLIEIIDKNSWFSRILPHICRFYTNIDPYMNLNPTKG